MIHRDRAQRTIIADSLDLDQGPAARKGGTFACRPIRRAVARRGGAWQTEWLRRSPSEQPYGQKTVDQKRGESSSTRRFGRVAAVLALAVLGAINVRAQSAADFAQMAAYAAAQQNADGGF